MKNLHAPSAPTKDAFEYVTIPNYKPARAKFNQFSGEVFCNFEPVVKPEKGIPSQTLNYRATNKALLRDKIEAKHPSASFTTSANTIDDVANAKAALKQIREQARPVTERELEESYAKLKRAFGAGHEVTVDDCLRQGIRQQVFEEIHKREAHKWAADVTQAHRVLAADLSPQEQADLTRANVGMFSQEQPWKDWFKQFDGNFWSYPNLSNKNYTTLVDYCHARGWICPMVGEIEEAVRTLLEGGFFYLKSNYPRTLRDEFHAVRAFTGLDCIKSKPIQVDERQQVLTATKGMSANDLKQQLANARVANANEEELRRRGRLLR